jgi:hypothetical protein
MGMSGYVSVYGYRYMGVCGCRWIYVGIGVCVGVGVCVGAGVWVGADMCRECRCERLGLGQEKPG